MGKNGNSPWKCDTQEKIYLIIKNFPAPHIQKTKSYLQLKYI